MKIQLKKKEGVYVMFCFFLSILVSIHVHKIQKHNNKFILKNETAEG